MMVAPVRRSSIVIGKCLGGATVASFQGVILICLAGAVHDFMALAASVRHGARSVADITGPNPMMLGSSAATEPMGSRNAATPFSVGSSAATAAASAVVLRFANSALDLEEEGRQLRTAVGPIPAATVDQGHGPSNAAEDRSAQ